MIVKTIVVIISLIASNAYAEILSEPPEQVNQEAKYFFFGHGAGLYKNYADRARENWQDKVNAIEDLGFIMITEERERGGDDDYALKIAEWIDTLTDKGVPAKNIYVGGYSRGARLAIAVSDIVSNNQINYFLLAGCYHNDEFGADIKGRILSVYDDGDSLFSPCADFITNNHDINFKEIVVNSGYEHGMGASVRDDWMEPLVAWLKNQ